MYFGVRPGDAGVKAAAGAVGPSTLKRVLRSPRELALMQRLYACKTGARQAEEAAGAACPPSWRRPVSSRVFAGDVTVDPHPVQRHLLCGTFGGLI